MRDIQIDAIRYDSAGLIPCVVQNANSNNVLMLGYMNQKALEQTIQSNLVTFFSRSRSEIWVKGETSGNTLKLVSIAMDCDSDALLAKVIPNGPTCHTGAESCFDEDGD